MSKCLTCENQDACGPYQKEHSDICNNYKHAQKKAGPVEADVQTSIYKYLNAIGFVPVSRVTLDEIIECKINGVYGRINTMGTFNALKKIHYTNPLLFMGFVDLIAVKLNKHNRQSQWYYIEVKKPGGKQNDNQLKVERLMKMAGMQYILAQSSQDVERVIR
jgi:hypothetical protein